MTELADSPQIKTSAKKLALESLEIKNFRSLQDLRIEKLGRVNLIAGKNGVGKSSVLEALQLYATQSNPIVIQAILENHQEIETLTTQNAHVFYDGFMSAIKNLFYGRIDVGQNPAPIIIGPLNPSDKSLIIEVRWNRQNQETPKLEVTGEISFSFDPTKSQGFAFYPPANYKRTRCEFLPVNGFEERQISVLWDKITLTNLEDEVIRVLRIINLQVERVNLINFQENGASSVRMPIVRFKNESKPVPLLSLGDGMRRIFGIILALVNSQDGFLLVDEIENGLHYTVQLDLWRIIFDVARRLNVQVFATTHNWDCIEAFQKAASEDQESEGMLIRLQNIRGELVPSVFNEHDLEIITKEQIEVR